MGMSNYTLILKIAIMVYTAWSYFGGDVADAALFITSLLILAALSFLMPVFEKSLPVIIFSGLSITIICVFSNMFPLLILLVPVLVLELTTQITPNRLASCAAVFLGAPAAVRFGLEGVFLLVSVFSCILAFVSHRDRSIALLEKQNRELLLKNRSLIERMDYHEDLKRQLTYTAQLEERNRIAQELHDKVGHSLSGSIMQLEAVKVIADSDPPKASLMLQTVIDTLRSGLDNIRTTLRNTKPPQEQMGINRLKLILNEFMEKNSVRTTFTYEGDIGRIKPVVWKIITENTIEALTNVLRHSKADSVNVTLNVMNRITSFRIKDNGSTGGAVKKGLGLTGMEERLSIVNGRLIIDNSDGFSVTMLVPDGGGENADQGAAG